MDIKIDIAVQTLPGSVALNCEGLADQPIPEMDLYLLGEGSDKNVYRKLGAHLRTVGGVTGTRFAVWAPNASRVSVVGDFNSWDGRRHVMRLHPGNGIWEIFVPGIGNGTLYKYEITDADGKVLRYPRQKRSGANDSRNPLNIRWSLSESSPRLRPSPWRTLESATAR